jgi:hypothetical protein
LPSEGNRDREEAEGIGRLQEELQIGNYFRFLRWFSKERGALPIGHSDDYGRTWSYQDVSGWYYSRFIEGALSNLFYPVQDKGKIIERQNITKYLAQDSQQAGQTRELIRTMFDLEAKLYEEMCEHERERTIDTKLLEPFAELVDSFGQFREGYSSEGVLRYFASYFNSLLRENPVTRRANVLRGGINLVAGQQAQAGRKFYLVKNLPESSLVFDLGLFKQGEKTPMHYYPGETQDVLDMKAFVLEAATPVFLLGAFLYQAEVYRVMKRLGEPVCFPNINQDGLFRVKNASPLTTYLVETPRTFSFEYDRSSRKFLFGGAHSGGKSELIKNIGGLHLVGLGGGIVPCEEGAEIPLTRRIVTSFRKSKENHKGSLESEVKEILRIERESRENDLLLIDEFLDTTKPELAMHIADPLLGGIDGVCRGLANTPAAVFIIDHRASRMEREFGFKFMYPILREADEPQEPKIENTGGEAQIVQQPKSILVPTHEFGTGKPNPVDVRRHALQMWERVKKRVFSSKRRDSECYVLGQEIRTYGLFDKEEPGYKSVPADVEAVAWIDWRELRGNEIIKETPKPNAPRDSSRKREKTRRELQEESKELKSYLEKTPKLTPPAPKPEDKPWNDEEDNLPF